jgi:hypothetical protein
VGGIWKFFKDVLAEWQKLQIPAFNPCQRMTGV